MARHKTDSNIDHRRVPNLMTYFASHHATIPISSIVKDYLPGDVVAWELGQGIFHIGIIVDKKSGDAKRNLIAHNIGNGRELSDCLMLHKIIGHYRYKK